MFEAAAELYKLLIPMFEIAHDYKKLADAHGDLQVSIFTLSLYLFC
jgi:hypothetical protein